MAKKEKQTVEICRPRLSADELYEAASQNKLLSAVGALVEKAYQAGYREGLVQGLE